MALPGLSFGLRIGILLVVPMALTLTFPTPALAPGQPRPDPTVPPP